MLLKPTAFDEVQTELQSDDFYLPENIGRSQMESFLYGIQTQSPNGVLGDPTGSTPDSGEELLELVAAELAADMAGAPSGQSAAVRAV